MDATVVLTFVGIFATGFAITVLIIRFTERIHHNRRNRTMSKPKPAPSIMPTPAPTPTPPEPPEPPVRP